MLGSWQTNELPNLEDTTGKITSTSSNRYNCIAWAAGVDTQWWWPDAVMVARRLCYWPRNVPVELTFDAFFQAYATLGYDRCLDGSLEAGFEKIAIFGQKNFFGMLEPTHAALQLSDGRWTSKLGRYEDIEHDTLVAVSGPIYGIAVFFMRRIRNS